MSGGNASIVTSMDDRNSIIGSARQIRPDLVPDQREQFAERLLGLLLVARRIDRSHQPHHRAIAASGTQRIQEQEPLHFILVREHATTLLEPVVNELPVRSLRDQRTIDGGALAGAIVDLDALEALDLPAVTRKARAR